MPTLEVLQAQIAKLRVQADVQRQKEIKRMRGEMQRLGITLEDLGGTSVVGAGVVKAARNASTNGAVKPSKQAGEKLNLAPKYRDPESGNTWTGRGRAPTWIRDAADRDEFLIKKAAPVKSTVKKSAAADKKTEKKTTSARAGKKLNLVPKYQDPDTGATWTGHGKAPGWIRDVENRDAFLIGKGRGAKSNGSKPAAAGKKVAKKVTAKKSTVRKVSAAQEPVVEAAQA